ncbi:MAG: ATP-binding protein [Candidatus Omnitrophica bacterium]|nr:ATP-binding protein [Candidatus Omnitrophota bacterium]
MKTERYLTDQIIKDLEAKMVFVAGPRQVGKTTLARNIITDLRAYLNWDVPASRECILKYELPDTKAYVFDEIHKYRKWRQFLKGLFDQYGKSKKILVTGSAKLDQFRYGGDSLQGRYHFLRLHPLSVAELKVKTQDGLRSLLALGGFPEPFYSGSEDTARRWSREYRSRLINEEINSLERVADLGSMELLAMRLPDCVGSPLSVNSLREDLDAGYAVVANWLKIMERFYMIFRLPPFGGPKIRAVKKEQKHYHFDWTLVSDQALRFENMVAAHLLKWVHYQQDVYGYEYDLRYFRDIDGREVDFVLLKDLKPAAFIEAKWSDDQIGKGLKYLKNKYPGVDSWQISAVGSKDYISKEGIRVCPALKYLSGLV